MDDVDGAARGSLAAARRRRRAPAAARERRECFYDSGWRPLGSSAAAPWYSRSVRKGEAPLAEAGADDDSRRRRLVEHPAECFAAQVGDALDRAMREGGRFGVVLFSDIAYELLPPGTLAEELAGLRRYFVPVEGLTSGVPALAVGGTRFLESPWNRVLTAGTKHLDRSRARPPDARPRARADGKVVLVSDLEDEYLDLPSSDACSPATPRSAAAPCRGALADGRRQADLPAPAGGIWSARRCPAARCAGRGGASGVPFPVALACVAVLLAVVLGVNEHLLARLPLLAGEGRR